MMSSRRRARESSLDPGPPENGGGSGPRLPDQDERDAIITERERNMVVIAGAGTGKTTMIVRRIVDLVAPEEDRRRLPLDRLAAITFTRRAAGELRYRIREALLRQYATARVADSRRAEHLLDAISKLDAAFIGTIHGFAERLLRLRPVEAHLSPSYEIAEETAELVRETLERLRRGAEDDNLAAGLGAHGAGLGDETIREAIDTLRAFEDIGILLHKREGDHAAPASLEDLIGRMIETRDVDLDPPPPHEPGLEIMRGALRELEELLGESSGEDLLIGERSSTGEGHIWLRRAAGRLQQILRESSDPTTLCRVLRDVLREGKDLDKKGRDFPGIGEDFEIAKALMGKPVGKKSAVPPDLGQRLKQPYTWLAAQLARLRPVVLAQYEQVKVEHGQVDQIDLLLKLRDLLRSPERKELRAFYQGLFDHLLIDEFQDTDPLQVEVTFFLGEEGQEASDWRQVRLEPGKLTLVGDPQQSIYRFRRADIVTYQQAVDQMLQQGAVERRLCTNFRSRPELIELFNATLAKLLGTSDRMLDPETGRAAYEPLASPPSAATPRSATPQGASASATAAEQLCAESQPETDLGEVALHLVPYAGEDGEPFSWKTKSLGRPIEAEATACYVRWLLGRRLAVRDPDSGLRRSLRPGDIAVLAPTTTHLPLLLRQFDRLGIGYVARGGHLFLGHAVVRRMLLALRALADRDDGVAEVTLLSPPFLALEPADLAAEQIAIRSAAGSAAGSSAGTVASAIGPGSADFAVRLRRVADARAIVRRLRHARHHQSPGATARDLIEQTGLGRQVVCGPNGRQILTSLYAVAFELDRLAHDGGIDFDAATVQLRQWAETPVYRDPPEPIDARAVQVMSIHQAKGLEFPVVILWDGFADLGRAGQACWMIGRGANRWSLRLEDVRLAEPPGDELARQEKRFDQEERRRLYYVAATRARDLLVLPAPDRKPAATRKQGAKSYAFGGDNIYIVEALREEVSDRLAHRVERLTPYRRDAVPDWASDDGRSGSETSAGWKRREHREQESAGSRAGKQIFGEPMPELVADPRLGKLLQEARATVAEKLAEVTAPVAVPMGISRAARLRLAERDGTSVPSARDVAPPPDESGRAGEDGFTGLEYADGMGDGEGAGGDATGWEAELDRQEKQETARHGPAFGIAVHRALQFLVAGHQESPDRAIELAALEAELEPKLVEEARRDVENALGLLEREGLLALSSVTEHPVTYLRDGRLMSGLIDLLVPGEDEVLVIDYKTDRKRPGSIAAAYPQYAAQLELYGEALEASGLLDGRRLRLGLLLTERGELKWLEP